MNAKYILGAFCAIAFGLSSCTETWDDSPVLKTYDKVQTASFLNEPQMKSAPVMITESNNKSNLNLTCSQPDFGYAAAAAYQVQMSLTPEFTDYQEIRQRFYNCAQINPLYSDVASAIEYLSGVRSEADLPLPYQKVYVRLKAFVPQDPDHTTFLSNVVSYDAISADYLAIWVGGVPVNIWVRGGMNDWGAGPFVAGATEAAEWQLVTGPEQDTWVYDNITITAGTQFKLADDAWANINLGAPGDAEPVAVEPNKSTTLAESGKNLTVAEDFTGKITLTLSDGIYYIMLTPAQ